MNCVQKLITYNLYPFIIFLDAKLYQTLPFLSFLIFFQNIYYPQYTINLINNCFILYLSAIFQYCLDCMRVQKGTFSINILNLPENKKGNIVGYCQDWETRIDGDTDMQLAS